MADRRTGDTIEIQGDYQYLAYQSANPVQRFWHTSKSRMVASMMPPDQQDYVLDVGCGSGVVTDFLSQYGANVTGIDANPNAISFASQKFQRPNISFQMALVDEEFSVPSSVDKIYCMEVIEHIYMEQGLHMLKSFYRLLKPGGTCLITTPNYASAWPLIEWVMDKFGLAPKMADDQHVSHYTPGKLKAVAQSAGFTVRKLYVPNLIAPWLAPISWKFAEKVEDIEKKINLPLGLTLAVVLEKPG